MLWFDVEIGQCVRGDRHKLLYGDGQVTQVSILTFVYYLSTYFVQKLTSQILFFRK